MSNLQLMIMTRLSMLYFLVLFWGCSHNNSSEIGFLFPNLSDQRYLKDSTYFGERARELGIKVVFKEARNDPKLQEQQANDLINDGVSLLIVSAVNQNLAAAIVRNAHEKNIKVIAYERLINNCDLDYLVTFDHEKVGKLQAQYLTQRCKKGNYVIIGGDKSDRNAELIYKGQMKILEPYTARGDIKILYTTFIEDWSPENAAIEFKRILDLSPDNPNAVLSANDGMAGGIIDILEKYNAGDTIFCTGLDADLSACRRIAREKQTMTVYKPFKKMAYITADLAAKLLIKNSKDITFDLTNNGYKDIQTIVLEPIAVDFDNLRATIIKDGFLTEKEIFSD